MLATDMEQCVEGLKATGPDSEVPQWHPLCFQVLVSHMSCPWDPGVSPDGQFWNEKVYSVNILYILLRNESTRLCGLQ